MATPLQVDQLQPRTASNQLVQSFISNMATALKFYIMKDSEHTWGQTLAIKVLIPLHPSASAATPAAVIISHQEMFTDTS